VASKATVKFSVESGPEAIGINAAPAKWFNLPASATAKRGSAANGFDATVKVPANAAPGQYNATIVATASIGNGVTQTLRIPVQFFVPVKVAQEITGPIWASDATDYSIVGFENPEGQIYTDWEMVPVRVPNDGTKSLTFNVWDEAGVSTMDVFVFDGAGAELGSTVNEPGHAVPEAAALSSTSKDAPGTVTLDIVTDPAAVTHANDLPGFTSGNLLAGSTVWLVVSDTKPAVASPTNAAVAGKPVFETYHLKITTS